MFLKELYIVDEKQNSSIFKGLNGDLVEFADRVSAVLGCPITIEDANHRLIAYSMHDDSTDQARIATIIGRRVPEKVINSLWREGVIPKLLKDPSPVLIPSITEVGLGKRAAISIRKNQEVLGFIWALETTKEFTEHDLHFLELAAKEAKNQLLQLQMRKKRKDESYQEFLWKLLTGHYEDEADIYEKLSDYGMAVPEVFTTIVFTFPDEITTETERNISYMLTTTQKVKPLFFTININHLIVLASPVISNPFPASINDFISVFTSQMETRFSVRGIQGAAGQSYTSLSKAQDTYQEALYTLKIKRIFPEITSTLHLYSDLGIYQYLDVLSTNQRRGAEHKGLLSLKEYDAKNQTDLVRTLHMYLQHDGNPYDTANSLHLHVNTIHYRLKRISEIGRIELKNPLVKMALFFELLLEKFIEANSRKM